jgi:predicted transcriptional regulator
MTSKVMSLRLPWDLADAVAAVARTDQMPVSKAIREAIVNHVASRQADHAFQKRLRKRLEEDREALERLAE